MLMHCSISIQDPTGARPNTRYLNSCVLLKKVDDEFYLLVKNTMYPTAKSYELTMLQNIYHNFIREGKMELDFSEPRQLLLIVCKDKALLYLFFRKLKNIINGKDEMNDTRQAPRTVPPGHEIVNRFHPSSLFFVSYRHFDIRILNMRHLNTLVLEDCDLPTIPVQIGNLPISSLSITGSKLPTSQNELDVFWNFTSLSVICYTLRTLKMDSIGMKHLPFEIFFLKNLQTLSASNNNLSYIPHCIGELHALENLFVADNSLLYFPYTLSHRTFKEIDISNNPFELPRPLKFDHIAKYIEKYGNEMKNPLELTSLTHLALNNLLKYWLPFKRQDIPRSLWICFEVIGRCMLCRNWILPNNCRIAHTFALPSAENIIKDNKINGIPWQSLLCQNANKCERLAHS
ncbi:hypothetical protein QTP88_019768 [Uroleucon formosanum]